MTAKRYVRLAIVLCLFSLGCLVAQDSPHKQTIVLPNPDLIGCAGKTCAPPLDFIGDPSAMIFPTQIALDIGEKGCQCGFMAYYDKSVSADQLRVALNDRYPNATDPVGESPRGFWRLESEKVMISLGTIDQSDHERQPDVEIGTKRLIYLRISTSCRPRK